MDKIIPLPEIAKDISRLTNTDVETAKRFLTEFFRQVESAFVTGEEVTVAKIGTFKRTNNPETPVLFTPDSIIADAINMPFSAFEAVELDDDITETDLEAAAKSQGQDDANAQENTTTSEMPTADADAHTVIATKPAEAVQDEEPPVNSEPIEEQAQSEETVSVEPSPKTPEKEESDEGFIEESEEEYIDEYNSPRKHHTALWVTLALLLGIIIGFTAEYFLHDRIERMIACMNAHENEDGETKIKPDIKAPTDTAKTISTTETDDNETIAPEPVDIKLDTVTTTRYITTMAQEYYGNRAYWVYIYKENTDRLGHPEHTLPGQEVRIPPFEKYRTSTDPEKNLSDAKQLAVEIYSAYR